MIVRRNHGDIVCLCSAISRGLKYHCMQVFEQCCEKVGSCPTLRKLSKDKNLSLCELAPNRCDDDGHLVHLSLSSEGLECRFPKAVSKLTSLTRLDLTFNQLAGRWILCKIPLEMEVIVMEEA